MQKCQIQNKKGLQVACQCSGKPLNKCTRGKGFNPQLQGEIVIDMATAFIQNKTKIKMKDLTFESTI